MSLSELLLILLVALIVIGPQRLPEVVQFLIKGWRYCKSLTAQLEKAWEEETKHLQLQENEKKAAAVDAAYQDESEKTSP